MAGKCEAYGEEVTVCIERADYPILTYPPGSLGEDDDGHLLAESIFNAAHGEVDFLTQHRVR